MFLTKENKSSLYKVGSPPDIPIVALIGIWFVGWKVPTVQLQPQPN